MEGPARVILLLDGSGSMRDWVRLEKSIGQGLLREAPPGVSFAVAEFASQMEARLLFSEGFTAVAKEVGTLGRYKKNIPGNENRTVLYYAVESGISMFGQHRIGDTICVITDGDDNSSHFARKEVEQSLLVSGTRVFGALLPSFVDLRMG